MQAENLIKKIRRLPIPRQVEVEDFVDFLAQRDDQQLIYSAMKTSEQSFEAVWENEEDSIYDKL